MAGEMGKAKCFYCGAHGIRFRVARLELWCGSCPLPAPEKNQPAPVDEHTEQLLTANPEE